VTCIYPAPHTHPAPPTHPKQLLRGPHIDWPNSCAENPEKNSTEPQRLDRQKYAATRDGEIHEESGVRELEMYVNRSSRKHSGVSTGN